VGEFLYGVVYASETPIIIYETTELQNFCPEAGSNNKTVLSTHHTKEPYNFHAGDEGGVFLRNIGTHPPHFTAS
jgi:hypothetical protein